MSVAAPFGLSLALLTEALGWAIAASLLVIWRATIGAMLIFIADRLVIHVHIAGIYNHHFDLGYPFRAANTAVHDWLQAEKDGLSIEIGWTWHALKECWTVTAQMLEWAVHETDATFDWFRRNVIPKAVLIGLGPIGTIAALRKLIETLIEQALAKVGHATRVIVHDVTHVINRTTILRVSHALPSPWSFPKFRRAWHELEAWRRLTRFRLRRLEALLAASGLALAVANMTGTRFKCWRPGGNIHKLLRGICGAPTGLISDLLGIFADVWLLENVCALLPLLETVASDVGTPLVDALTVVGAGLCKGVSKPGRLRGPAVVVPPVYFGTALAV